MLSMRDSPRSPRHFVTPDEALRALPSCGPDWEAAIAHGIDVSLLVETARLTPAERVRRLGAANRFAEDVQSRTLPARVRAQMAERRLAEKLAALGQEM